MSKPISSERAEQRDLIKRTFSELGGQATAEEVFAHVAAIAPKHLNDFVNREGWMRGIGEFFRSKSDSGLPVAPHIGEGVHMDLELFSVEDFRWVINHQIATSKSSRSRALRYQQACMQQHGVLVDLDDPMAVAS